MFVEGVRLMVVLLATGAAFTIADGLDMSMVGGDPETGRLLATVLGAGVGYVLGGIVGRMTLGRIDHVERHLAHITSGELIAGTLGGVTGLLLAAGLLWPLLLLGHRLFTVPFALLVIIMLVTAGLRLGSSRGGDLLRYVGAGGRIDVSAPSTGASAKLVDTSALIDGRLLEVCRAGFCEGTLVLPEFVLYELQGLADAGEHERRSRGRRGLDVLGGLQRSAGINLEVTTRDYPDVDSVDAKLVTMARDRGCALITVDANLASIAEVQGLTVMNLNALAETLRPPVLPGDVLEVRIAKPGKEADQGIGYLSDGTMVVVEGAAARKGEEVACEVTSILSNSHGRMVFATFTETEPLRSRAVV